MQGVMFEMIQPDLEIFSTHAATLLIAQHRVWELNRAVQWRNSGGLWRRLRGVKNFRTFRCLPRPAALPAFLPYAAKPGARPCGRTPLLIVLRRELA
jgi:hypothetical protein